MADRLLNFFGSQIDPAKHDCEWCDPPRKAAHAFEPYRRGKPHTGQFIYGCHRHKRIAEISADPRKDSDAAA
jgi:hypothetical protein